MRKKTLTFFLAIFLIGGCAQLKKYSHYKASPTNSTVQYTNNYQKSTSYDFPDIPIPKELVLDHKKSLVFESATQKVGILVYKGRVDSLSLFEYFESKLPQMGWKLRSFFKYGKYMILFSKESRDLVIRIQDKGFTTEIYIWVVPRTDNSLKAPANVIEEEIKP